jgi:hypothetical protein
VVHLPVLAILAFLLAACGPAEPLPADIPVADECASPGSGALGSLQIGSRQDPFVPFADGDPVEMVYGSQGGAMIPMRLRVTGEALPSCLPMEISIDGPHDLFGTSTAPLATYEERDGSRITGPLFVIGDPGEFGDYEVTAASLGTTATVRLVIEGY